MSDRTQCDTCGGCGWIVEGQTWEWPYGEQIQCPDCFDDGGCSASGGTYPTASDLPEQENGEGPR